MPPPRTSLNSSPNAYPNAMRLFWIALIGVFVAVGAPNVFRKAARSRIHFAGPFHSTDNFLHFETGEIDVTQKLLALFASVPATKKIVIFVRGDDRQSGVIGMLVAYLAWPHPARIVDVTQPGWEASAGEKDLGSVGKFVFCRVGPPGWWPGGDKFGETLEVFSAPSVAQE